MTKLENKKEKKEKKIKETYQWQTVWSSDALSKDPLVWEFQDNPYLFFFLKKKETKLVFLKKKRKKKRRFTLLKYVQEV